MVLRIIIYILLTERHFVTNANHKVASEILLQSSKLRIKRIIFFFFFRHNAHLPGASCDHFRKQYRQKIVSFLC